MRALLNLWTAFNLSFGLILPFRVNGEDEKPVAISFTREIAPIFVQKCLKCHGSDKFKGGYQLHTFELLQKSGDSKNASIVAGKPKESELFRRLTTSDEDDRMPQKDDPLPASQLALIERWIQAGALFDGTDPKMPLVKLIPKAPYPDPPDKYDRPFPILALAFAPNGSELAVSGYHEISIWNPAEGKLLRRIKNVAERTQALAFSPDGLLLAAAGGAPGQLGEVALFDPRSGERLRVLDSMTDVMFCLAFQHDGARLAVGGADNTIHVFSVATGKEELAIQQHADWVMAVDFNKDGTQLASASRDRSARVYNSKTGELEVTYAEHTAPVFAVAFAPDGKRVYSAGREKKVHGWTTADGKKVREMSGFEDDVLRILAGDDQLFVCSADKQVRQYSAKDGDFVRAYEGHNDWVYALSFDPTNKRLASGSHDGEVRIWNVKDGTLLKAFKAVPGYLAAGGSN